MKKPDVSFLLVFFLFVSCASAPQISISGDDDGAVFYLLPSGARVYLWADTVEGRPLIDVISFDGKSAKDAGQILDNTKLAAAALFPEGEAHGRSFFLAAKGNYPRIRANFSFGLSRGWKKQKSSTGGSYWYSGANDIALALGSDLALVSNIDPVANLTAAVQPEGFGGFRRGFALAGWLGDPAYYINNFFGAMGIPMQIPAEDFFFGAARTAAGTEPWELVFKIRVASAVQARGLLSLFSLARVFILAAPRTPAEGKSAMSPGEMAALLFANIPEQDGEYLIIRTDPLNEDKIALLFQAFSLYSK